MPQALRLLLHACLGLPSAVEAARTDENGHMMTGHGIPFVRTRFRTIAFHTLLFVSIFVTAAVQATDLPLRGGPGGSPFRRECSGDFVVGIYVRSSDWVDAIGLKCGIFNRTRGNSISRRGTHRISVEEEGQTKSAFAPRIDLSAVSGSTSRGRRATPLSISLS